MEKKKRTPVELTEAERQEVSAAMERDGYRSMAEFFRVAGLEKARKGSS